MFTLEVNLKGQEKPVYVHDCERYDVQQAATTTQTELWLHVYGKDSKEIGRFRLNDVSGYHQFEQGQQ